MTRRIAPLILALTLASPLAAQEGAPSAEAPSGGAAISEGFRLFLRGVIEEAGEGWADLVDWLEDLSAYEAPERLPNGDIIIRRKPEAPLLEGETEI